MKQFYYTSCRPDRSISGSSGFQIRACTGEVTDQVRGAVRMVGYEDVRYRPSDSSPVKLALFDSEETGRVVCHAVDGGADPTTGRSGNFFSHAIVDLPDSVTASAVIQSWGSPEWVRCDSEAIDTSLPELGELSSLRGSLDGGGFRDFVRRPDCRELVSFVAAAVLAGGEEQIVVAADSERMAWCVWGVTRVLPAALVENLTFSTFERDPLGSYATIVGTVVEEGRDLPAICYQNGLAFNTFTGQRSEVVESDFVVQALTELAEGETAWVDRAHSVFCSLGLDAAEELSLLHRFWVEPAKAFRDVLQTPKIATIAVKEIESAELGRLAADWLIEDPEALVSCFGEPSTLSSDEFACAQLYSAVRSEGVATIEAGDDIRAGAILSRYGRLAPVEFHVQLLQAISSVCGAISRPVGRLGLAYVQSWSDCVARIPDGAAQPPVEPLLFVERAYLVELLSLPISTRLKARAVAHARDRDGGLTDLVYEALRADPDLLRTLIEYYSDTEDGVCQATAFFAELAALNHARLLATEVLRSARVVRLAFIDETTEELLSKVPLVDIVAAHGRELGRVLAGSRTAARIRQGLANEPASCLSSRGIRDFFRSDQPQISVQDTAGASRLVSLVKLSDFVERLSQMEPLPPATFFEGIVHSFSSDEWAEIVRRALVPSFWGRLLAESDVRERRHVAMQLFSLSGLSAWPELFTKVARHAMESAEEGRESEPLATLVLIGFGAWEAPCDPDRSALEVAAEIACYLRVWHRSRYDQLRNSVRKWPDSSKAAWKQVHAIIQPPGLKARYKELKAQFSNRLRRRFDRSSQHGDLRG